MNLIQKTFQGKYHLSIWDQNQNIISEMIMELKHYPSLKIWFGIFCLQIFAQVTEVSQFHDIPTSSNIAPSYYPTWQKFYDDIYALV